MDGWPKWLVVIVGVVFMISGIALIGLGMSEISNAATQNCFPGQLGCTYTFTCNGANTNCTNITSIIQQAQQQQFQAQQNPQQVLQQQSNAMFGAWVTVVLGIVLAPIGFIIMLVGFLYNPARRLLDTSFPTSSSSYSPSKVYCKNCGTEMEISSGDRFCRNCGTEITSSS